MTDDQWQVDHIREGVRQADAGEFASEARVKKVLSTITGNQELRMEPNDRALMKKWIEAGALSSSDEYVGDRAPDRGARG